MTGLKINQVFRDQLVKPRLGDHGIRTINFHFKGREFQDYTSVSSKPKESMSSVKVKQVSNYRWIFLILHALYQHPFDDLQIMLLLISKNARKIPEGAVNILYASFKP